MREAYVTILRQIAEAHGVNFAAVRSGKIKMFLQSFAIGTVLIKIAHVQTAEWGQLVHHRHLRGHDRHDHHLGTSGDPTNQNTASRNCLMSQQPKVDRSVYEHFVMPPD